MFVWIGMQERPEVLDTVLELKLQAVMSRLAWVLGAELALCKSGMHVLFIQALIVCPWLASSSQAGLTFTEIHLPSLLSAGIELPHQAVD